MKKAVQFGAGNIGRGFIGALLSQSGYHVVFADVVDKIIDKINEDKTYTVHVMDVECEDQKIENISGVNSTKPEAVDEIASADLVTTAVGLVILPRIAPTIAAAIEKRMADGNKEPMNIIACENAIRGTSQLKKAVYENLSEEGKAFADEYVGFPDCAVDRRIRLGSLEPRIITEEFVKELVKCDKVCPHFHLSLQSGCDQTLKRMNRKYTTEEYEEALNILRKYYEHPALTTDVIAGFVGETEEEFEKTRAYLEKINLYEMHIFKYSVREGTRAQKMSGHVPEQVKTERSEVLLSMAKRHKTAFEEWYVGRKEKVLLEEIVEKNGKKYFQGYTAHYVKVAVELTENDTKLEQNEVIVVDIQGFIDENLLYGKVSIEF